MLATEDIDAFHDWNQDDPDWIETFWFGTWVPEARTTVYIYQWFRPVLGIYGGGCFVWDDSGHLPWDIPFYRYEVNRPLRLPVNLDDLSLDCGTTLRTVEKGRVYDVAFARDDVAIDLRFVATTPPDVIGPEGVGSLFAGHIDQAGRYTGTIKLGERKLAVDCHGIRDRSWGARVIGDDIRMNYFHGQSADLAFLGYSKPDGTTETLFKGYLSRDGVTSPVAEGTRSTHYADGKLDRIEMVMVDAAGRRIEATGRPLNTLVHEPYPGLINWLHLIEWRVGDALLYGEEQDVWSTRRWRDRDRTLGGRR